MFRTHRLHAHARFTVRLEARHVTQHQAHLVSRFQTLHHLLIQLVAVLEEVIDGPFLAARRYQRLNAHLPRLNVVARFTRQDHQLTHHVFTGKVNARIRFG